MNLAAALPPAPCFVFGSNRLGIHGAGAARWAREHRGAVAGQGEGRQGCAYAIPTKATPRRVLPLAEIRGAVDRFRAHAIEHPTEIFEVTPIGCGLAGYRPTDIAPFFDGAPPNCWLPESFLPHVAARPLQQRVVVQRHVTLPCSPGQPVDVLYLQAVAPKVLDDLICAARAKGWHLQSRNPDVRAACMQKPCSEPTALRTS